MLATAHRVPGRKVDVVGMGACLMTMIAWPASSEWPRGTHGNGTIIPTTDEDRETNGEGQDEGQAEGAQARAVRRVRGLLQGSHGHAGGAVRLRADAAVGMTTRLWEYMKRHRLATQG